MEFTETRLNRLWGLVLLLHDSEGYDMKALQHQTQASRATLFRDLEVLEQAGIPVIKRQVGRKVNYLVQVPDSIDPNVMPAQAFAVLLSTFVLSSLGGGHLAEIVGQLIARKSDG